MIKLNMQDTSNLKYEELLEAYQANYQRRMKLRMVNFHRVEKDVQSERPKCSQLRVIQKFITKLKADPKNTEAILSEIDGLNLSKFVQEISCIIANSVSEKQIPFYAEVATKVNQSYDKVSSILLEDLNKAFLAAFQSSDDNKHKLKSLLLFTAEIFVSGFAIPAKDVTLMLKNVFKSASKKKLALTVEAEMKLFAYYYNSEAIASFFSNYGIAFTNKIPRWMSGQAQGQLAKYPVMVSPKTKEQISKFAQTYVQQCRLVLLQAMKKLKEYENELRSNLRMSGQISKECQKKYTSLIEKYNITKLNLKVIADSISQDCDFDELNLNVELPDTIMRQYINITQNAQIFQNEFQKQLYQALGQGIKNQCKLNTDEKYSQYKEKLSQCKTITECNKLAKEFEDINNKKTRRLLAKDITQYRKDYLLLTPFLCRLGAIVALSWKDMADNLNQILFTEYDKIKDVQVTSYVLNDKKNRIYKFLCEFTKFKILEPDRIMCCLQRLLDDLNGHNIELFIFCLENAGRFLYISPQSSNKFAFLISKLENIMKQRSFGLSTTAQLLNCISTFKLREQEPSIQPPPKTDLQKQVQKIFELNILDDYQKILTQLKIILQQEQFASVVVVKTELMRRVETYEVLGSYNYVYLLENMYCEQLNNLIIDETIQQMIRTIKNCEYQKSLVWSRFLAELFRYSIIRRSYLFTVMEDLLKIEYNDVGVINEICMILETAEEEFLSVPLVSKRNMLFRFLVKFKEFIHKSPYIPMLQEFKISDIFEHLQPNLANTTLDTALHFLNSLPSQKNEVCLSEHFAKYLRKIRPKEEEDKTIQQDVCKIEESPNEENTINNIELFINQGKNFEAEYNSIIHSSIKDYSNRIAKQAYVERTIEKKKEKKKIIEGKKVITVIGRSGARFVKKDIMVDKGKIQQCGHKAE